MTFTDTRAEHHAGLQLQGAMLRLQTMRRSALAPDLASLVEKVRDLAGVVELAEMGTTLANHDDKIRAAVSDLYARTENLFSQMSAGVYNAPIE